MKRKIPKKLLSLFLAVVMLTTCAPLVAFASGMEWTQVASSDFTKAEWRTNEGGAIVQDDNGDNFLRYVDNVPIVGDTGNTMSWSVNGYNGTSLYNKDNGNAGIKIEDGYMYLSGYEGGTVTPITGAESFKIDLFFTHTDYDVSASTRYGFLLLGKTGALTKQNDVMDSSAYVFSQDADGPAYADGQQLYGNTDNGYNLSSNSSVLTVGQDYHYILTYNNGYFHAYITDADGNTVQNLFSAKHTINTSEIANICLGDDDSSYFSINMNYKSISFYTGEKNSASSDIPTSLNKYLFAYFTGNGETEEQIHLAVSDDGLNFEALNGNRSMLNLTASECYPKGEGIPESGSGIANSGHARDPYIMRAQDGSYYVFATDLNTQNGTNWANNSKILVWHIEDLTKIEEAVPWNIDMADIFGKAVDRAWAPQAIWDDVRGEYMLYWSNKTVDAGSTSIYYIYTPDFKTFTSEPKRLIANTSMSSTYDTIDGDIIYDNESELYYLFYKNDNEDDLYWATSTNVNGPYSGTNHFYDSDLGSLEGPQVYKLVSDGSYVMLADTYGNPRFAMFRSSDLDTLVTGRLSEGNISHLSPRHGSVTYITTEDYNALTDKYGKETYDSSAVKSGEDINDTLVARYFTNSDVTYDAASKNGSNTLTNVGVESVSNFNGKVAAKFTSNSSTSANKGGTYAYLKNTQELLNGINPKDGITLSWYGYGTSANSGRFFDLSTSDEGTIYWDGSEHSQNTESYAYATAAMEFGVNNHGSTTLSKGYMGDGYINNWHLYTMTITDSYFHFFVDGQLLRTIYSKDMSTITTEGTPSYLASMNEEWFNEMVSSNLFFGISSYGEDNMLDGYISDFRVYNKALSATDISNSLAKLDSDVPNTDVDSSHRIYFDPFETTTDGAAQYTKYDQTVEDPQNIHGQVLSFAEAKGSGVDSHYNYHGNIGNTAGYTISMFYNPGSEIKPESIYSVGDPSANQYFELLENGTLSFNWEENGEASTIQIEGLFGDSSLTADTWNHIVIQIVPSGGYDIVYCYIDGSLVKKVNTYTECDTSSYSTSRSMHAFFNHDHSVAYGKTYSFNGNVSDGFIDCYSIYDGIFSAESIFAQDSKTLANSLLKIAMSNFEEKMNSLNGENIYTNMSDAYVIYDRAKRYLAAITNGTKEMVPEEVTEIYVDMTNALNKMTIYTSPETVQGWSVENGTAIDASYTKNMLSKVNTSSIVQQSGTVDAFNSGVCSGSFVWLYDGNEMTAPINAGIYRQDKFATSIYGASIFVSSGDVALGDLWHFDDNTHVPNGNHYAAGWYMSYGTLMNNQNAESSSYTVGCQTDNWKFGSNYLKYTGSQPSSYWSSTTPNYKSIHYWTGTFGTKGYGTHDIVFNAPIYIINYVPVRDAMFNSERLDVLSNIYQYNPESAKDLLEAYDSLTSQTYLFDADDPSTNGGATQDHVEALANKLESGVNALEAVDIKNITPNADYQPLIDAENRYSDNYEELLEGDAYKQYTSSTWNAFQSAYKAVKEHFNSLDPYGEDQPFVTDNETIMRLTNNIVKSYAHLAEKADYTPVDEKVADGTVYTINNDQGNGTSVDDQIYTYSTYKPFSDAYGVADKISANTQDYKDNTPKYEVSYVKTNPDNGEYGPYIAFDANGNVVKDNVEDLDYYAYVGQYYDKEEDGSYSENYLETGDYICIDGEYINVRDYRYTIDNVSTSVLSQKQQNINTAGTNLEDTNNALAKVAADYDAYDATTTLLKYQDMAAFTDKYLESESSVYALVAQQGTRDAQVTYSNGVSTGKTVNTPAYSEDQSAPTAYITAEGRVWKNQNDQGALDTSTTAMLSALEEVNNDQTDLRRTYTVTFNIHLDDEDKDVKVSVPAQYYGDVYVAKISDGGSDVAGYSCYRWSVTDNGGTKNDIPAADSYTAMVNGDVTITAYCSKQEPDTEMAKVRILNQYGNAVQEYNVDADTVITVDQNQYKIGESVQNVADTPYFRFNSWTVNGKTVANGTEFTVKDKVNDENVVVLMPEYDIVESGAGPYTVTVDGKSVTPNNGGTIYYDTEVTVTVPEGSYGIAIEVDGKYYVASYLTSYEFFAVGDANFYAITKTDGAYTINGKVLDAESDSELISKLDAQLPFVYSSAAKNATLDGVTKYTTYSATTADVPESDSAVTVTEVGTIYTKDSNAAKSGDTFVIGAQNVNKIAAKNQLDTMQYFLRISNKDNSAYYTRAYIKYEYTAKVKMPDGSVETTVIQTIDYGNICFNGVTV